MVDGFGVEDEDRGYFGYAANNLVLKPCREKKTIIIGKSKFKGYIEQGDQVILVDDEKLDRAYTAAKAYREGYNAGYEEGKKMAMREMKSKNDGLLFKSGEDEEKYGSN